MYMRIKLHRFIYSFPLQLFAMHFRSDLLLLALWSIIFSIAVGKIGGKYGLPYLFWAPEYLGEVNGLSFALVGFGFGVFAASWNLTVYLLSAYRFPFLASLRRPFAKFAINNFILPAIFVIAYLAMHIRFGIQEGLSANAIATDCLSFLFGLMSLITFISFYFYQTNKDIFSFLKIYKMPPPDLQSDSPPADIPEEAGKHQAFPRSWRVETYLTETLRPRLVRSVAHYDAQLLQSVFKQNHINMLIAQFFSLIVLAGLGSFMENPYFRLPAAMTIFLLASVFTALFGAISYWFHRWRFPVLILLLVLLNSLSRHGPLHHENHAYGLNYQTKPAPYTHQRLQALCSPQNMLADKLATQNILENWLLRRKVAGNEKPHMIIFCASGGGLKADLMAIEALRRADSLFQGNFTPQIVLMAGASGGMLGMAWYRELQWQKQKGLLPSETDEKLLYAAAQNLINPITTSIVTTDLFLPRIPFTYDDKTYYKDRGYAFEMQFNEYTGKAFDKPLNAYREAEQKALIPLLFITPSIVNDGRRLIISAQKTSYMMTAPINMTKPGLLDIDAVDFQRLFENQDAKHLRFSTALRMNATFPYILPNVLLPSSPKIETMDAGFRDNYGLKTAIRFIHVFKDWILKNTAGVVIVQVQSDNAQREIPSSANTGIVEGLFNPLGLATQITHLQSYEHDMNLGFLYELFPPEKIHFIRFIYQDDQKQKDKTPISFHLTRRNRQDIRSAFDLPINQKSFKRLQAILLKQ